MGDGSLAAIQRRYLSRLRQSVLKWAVRLLAFELRAVAAITAGFAVSLIAAVPAALLTAFILGSLELDYEYVVWTTRIIQVSAIAVWFIASFKFYRYLKQRFVSP